MASAEMFVTPLTDLSNTRELSSDSLGGGGDAKRPRSCGSPLDEHGLPRIARGHVSLQGARHENEDVVGVVESPLYTFIFVCDGHGGKSLAKKFGRSLEEYVGKELTGCGPHDPPQDLADRLRRCYGAAVEASGHLRGGSTLAAGLVQLSTRIMIALQVGDSTVGALDPTMGALLHGPVVYYQDDADPTRPAPHGVVQVLTRAHTFLDEGEVTRYNGALQTMGWDPLVVEGHPNSLAIEGRVMAQLPGGEDDDYLPECSRSIEGPDARWDKVPGLDQLQQRPEITAWQLPMDRAVTMFAVCDGFESKMALPSMDRMARAICDCNAYLDEDILDGTVFSHYAQGYPTDKPLEEKIEWLRRQAAKVLPDKEWKRAHTKSCNAMVGLLRQHGGRFPTLTVNAQAALEAAAHLAVIMLSDDNISAQVVTLAQNAPDEGARGAIGGAAPASGGASPHESIGSEQPHAA